jgi:hypothetical protein
MLDMGLLKLAYPPAKGSGGTHVKNDKNNPYQAKVIK